MRGIEALNGIVWGPMGLGLLFGTGLLLTVRTGGFQLRRWGYWMRHTLGAILTDRSVTAHTAREEQAISQFQSLCTALAATIGTFRTYGCRLIGGPLGGYLADKAFKSVAKEQLLGQLASLVTIGIFLVLPGGTSGGLLVVLLLLVGIAMFLCKGTYFSIQPEMGIPTHISATAVAIATFVGYIPDMFVHTMFGNWIDAYGDAGYTKILFYGVGTAVLGVIAAVWAIAQAKKVAKRNAAAANAA